MIASLRGTVLSVKLNEVVVEVGGVGMRLLCPPSTLTKVHVGETHLFMTHLVVREDSLTLFGFSNVAEQECFEIIMGVSGIGPKVALAMLSVHTPESLRIAVSKQDAKAIAKTPGVGAKLAARFLLEIGDKLGKPLPEDREVSIESTVQGEHVVQAIVNLGWKENLALKAVETVQSEAGQEVLDESALLHRSLQVLRR